VFFKYAKLWERTHVMPPAPAAAKSPGGDQTSPATPANNGSPASHGNFNAGQTRPPPATLCVALRAGEGVDSSGDHFSNGGLPAQNELPAVPITQHAGTAKLSKPFG